MITLLLQILLAQDSQQLEIVVISDLNNSYGSVEYSEETHRAVEHIIRRNPDVVLVTGDMVAGQKKNLPYREMWNSFHETVTLPLAANGIPLAVSPGNHDASGYDAFSEEKEIFIDEWLAHKPNIQFVDDKHFPLYYAFLIQDILFVSLDNTVLEGLSQKQLSWLDRILKTKAKKKVVYGHLPVFPFATGKEKEILQDETFERLLSKHEVNAYISGHHHTYYPGYYDFIHMVSTPCLGSGSRFLRDTTERSAKGIISITIENDEIQVNAYDASNEFSLIPKFGLPEFMELSDKKIWRDDLIRYEVSQARTLFSDSE